MASSKNEPSADRQQDVRRSLEDEMRIVRLVLVGLIVLGISQVAAAQVIPASEYSLTTITGVFSWGYTDWTAYCSGAGAVDNVADLSAVDTLLSDGYSDDFTSGCPPVPPFNGIYNYPDSALPSSLEFEIAGGADAILDRLSFISSRNYDDATDITVEYAIDGGGWSTAITTTAGALGITTGSGATYDLDLGGVTADRFRFTLSGAGQVSLHEIIIEGQLAAARIPALSHWGVVIMTMLLAAAAVVRLRVR